MEFPSEESDLIGEDVMRHVPRGLWAVAVLWAAVAAGGAVLEPGRNAIRVVD
jgi:hypothetical protein